jgi:hypothetical protein
MRRIGRSLATKCMPTPTKTNAYMSASGEDRTSLAAMPWTRRHFRFCAGFWTPATRNVPQAQLAGVQKPPRHEVAGS